MDGRTWDAYGNQTSGSNFAYLHGYAGSGNYEEDKDSNLKLLGNRYYDPSIGRFLTPDPAASGSNWYSYCHNNPTGFQDPLGLRSLKVDDDGAFITGIANTNAEAERLANFWAGAGDSFSFGASGAIRKLLGVDIVDEDTGAYRGGQASAAIVMALCGDEEQAAEIGAEETLAEAGQAEEVAAEEEAACEAGSGNCFVAGTMVLMADGSSKPIEKIKAGDMVESRGEGAGVAGKLEAEPVTLPVIRMTGDVVTVKLDDGETVVATAEHRRCLQQLVVRKS